MISSAGINATIAQVQQFDSAVMSFKEKYNGIPGDSSRFSTYGNGDGLIACGNYGCGSGVYVASFWVGELTTFWSDMDRGKFTAGLTNIPFSSTDSATYVPKAKMGRRGSVFIAGAKVIHATHYNADRTAPKNYYAIMAQNQYEYVAPFYAFATTSATKSAVKPADALALDKKADDGIANTGDILSGAISDYSTPDIGGITETAATGCSASASYTITTDSEQCTPIIRMGSQTGSVQ